MLNREGDDHRLFPGLWRTEAVMQMMDEIRAPTGEIWCGKKQWNLLKNNVSSPMAIRDDLERKKKEEGEERRKKEEDNNI